jgi:hypothetical protein
MSDWLKSAAIILVVAYLLFDGIWRAQISDADLFSEQIPPWIEHQ